MDLDSPVPDFGTEKEAIVTSNSAYNLGLRSRFPKQLLGANLAGVCAREAPPIF